MKEVKEIFTFYIPALCFLIPFTVAIVMILWHMVESFIENIKCERLMRPNTPKTHHDYVDEINYLNRCERQRKQRVPSDGQFKLSPLTISRFEKESGTRNLGTVQAITRNKYAKSDYFYYLDDNGQMHKKENGEWVPVKSEFTGASFTKPSQKISFWGDHRPPNPDTSESGKFMRP